MCLLQQNVDKMEARSAMNTTHRNDGSRFSTSLPQPVVSQAITGPSLSPNASSSIQYGQGESTIDESTLARRTTAQRQLHGNPKPLLRRLRENKDKHINGRLSFLASQPVLVRSYTPETDNARPSASMSSDSAMQRVDLPPVEEFEFEAILRAIEPDIRSTLDSIAEICGRSKLSLANEYGSHIAPFGEIIPPSGELLAIQETSSDYTEAAGDVDGHIVIVDDDHELYGSPLGLLDDLRQTALATGFQRSPRVHRADEAHETRPEHIRRGKAPQNGTQPVVVSVARMEEFAATSKPGSKSLLGSISSLAKDTKTSKMTSPALLSETRFDAQGNRSSWPSVPPDTPRGSPMLNASPFSGHSEGHSQNTVVDKISLMTDVQDWMNWLKTIIQREKTTPHIIHSQPHSAENYLRELLVRDQDQAIAVPTA